MQITRWGNSLAVRLPAAVVEVLQLDELLGALHKADPRAAQIVELRYFGGLTIEETAVAMEISPATAKRHWQVARAWLFETLSDPA